MNSGTVTEDAPVIDTGFVCMLCLKVFDRNDLLIRHRRRCKTINRTSKRKACSACVRTKSKCCFSHPSCQRCMKRGEVCEYPNHPPTSVERTHLNQPAPQTAGARVDRDIVPSNPAVPNMATEPLSDLDWIFDLEMVDQLPHHQLVGLLTQNNSLDNPATPLGTSLESATFAPSRNQRSNLSDRSDLEASSSLTDPNMRIRTEHQSGFFMNPPLSDHLDMVSYPYTSMGHSIPQSTNAQLTSANGLVSVETYSSLSNAGPETPAENVAYSSTQKSSLTATSPEDSADRLYASRDYQTDQESSDYSNLPSSSVALTSSPSSSIGAATQQISNTKDLLSIVNSYSRLLLQDDYRSPFIHRKLYSGSYTDMSVMAKSGIAVCCAAAYENENSAKFVSKFIITERERLVHTFVSFFPNASVFQFFIRFMFMALSKDSDLTIHLQHRYSCIEEWDALHAMCIYQIIELLDSRKEKTAESGMKAAELHIPFLLKMTRQFCRNHPSANQSDDALEDTWQRWLVAETVRRTVFLVNTINILAGHENDCPSPYYEPLDDSFVFRMALPAPDPLWESRTAEAWQATRDRLGWLSSKKSTIETLLMDDTNNSREENGKEIPQIGRPGLSNSRELTNLILHCHVYHHRT